MERAPLPPHERSWRHPSELAADARRDLTAERASATARTAALTGGTATILLVGIVVFALTPRGPGNPSAMSSSPVERIAIASLSVPLGATATTTPSTPTSAPSAVPASTTATSTDVVPSTTLHPLSVQSTLVSIPPSRPLVTELGSEGFAVLASRTVVELTGPSPTEPGSIVVTRHGGSIAVASVIDAGDGEGLAVLHLDDATPGEPVTGGYQVAPQPPDDDSMVTVMSDEPISVEMSGLPEVDIVDASDGVAVVDTDGHLVGLYVDDADDAGGRFIPIDAALGDAIAPPD